MSTHKYLDNIGLGQVWAKIKALITQSDWEEDDSSKNSYVQNRPAIRAGEGENSIVEGQIDPDNESEIYTIYVTGKANDSTFAYTTQDTLPSSGLLRSYGLASFNYNNNIKYASVNSCDATTNTIVFNSALSTITDTLENAEVVIYYKYKIANGINSHAEGQCTAATGTCSHAEGQQTKAINIDSHAEGNSTTASGSYSHAEGSNSVASGTCSHAEGSFAKASGMYSHAEGRTVTASGMYSHAEGYNASASGQNSHAEGRNSIASNSCAHSEGFRTIASGDCSHAEGHGTVAIGARSHSEGGFFTKDLTLQGDANTLTYNVIDSPDFTGRNMVKERLMVYYKSTFFIVTNITMSNNMISTITLENTLDANNAFNSTVILNISSFTSGTGAHAEGNGTEAVVASHAEGAATIASGTNSHAEGNNTKASGSYSHAEGTASKATGDRSHAEGASTVSSGFASHAQNYFTIAAKYAQTALGTYNIEDTSATTTHPSEDADMGQYAVIVGNGIDDNSRSNAHTLDWSGNGWYAGKLTVGTGPVNNMDVATKLYADTIVADKQPKRLVVTVTSTYDETTGEDTYSADKTFIEVQAAMNEGRAVYFNCDGLSNQAYYNGSESTYIYADFPGGAHNLLIYSSNGIEIGSDYSYYRKADNGIIGGDLREVDEGTEIYQTAKYAHSKDDILWVISDVGFDWGMYVAKTDIAVGDELSAGNTGNLKAITVEDMIDMKIAASSSSVSCATIGEIEEMCDALGFQSVTIDTSDYESING